MLDTPITASEHKTSDLDKQLKAYGDRINYLETQLRLLTSRVKVLESGYTPVVPSDIPSILGTREPYNYQRGNK